MHINPLTSSSKLVGLSKRKPKAFFGNKPDHPEKRSNKINIILNGSEEGLQKLIKFGPEKITKLLQDAGIDTEVLDIDLIDEEETR